MPAANVNASMKTWNMSYEQFLSVFWTAKLKGKKRFESPESDSLIKNFYVVFQYFMERSIYILINLYIPWIQVMPFFGN